MVAFLFGLVMGVPLTLVIGVCVLDHYDRKLKDKPPTKDEWKIM